MFKNRLIALAISLLIHSGVLALLFLLVLKSDPVMPPPEVKEVELVPVGALGSQLSMGGAKGDADIDPRAESQKTPTHQSTPNPNTSPEPKESHQPTATEDKLLTDEHSTAPSAEALEAEKRAKEAAEAARKKKEQEERQRAIDNKVKGAFGKKDGKGTTNGKGTGTGGNNAVGSGFSLEGRSIVGGGGLPARPEGFPPTRGTVVVAIVVNDKGVVVSAQQRLKGTTITNSTTIAAAVQAARRTQFNAVPGASNQRGTITYHFDIK